jgi:hypothetical protein
MTVFTKIKKSILKLIWKHKRPRIATAILSKKMYYNTRLQRLQSHDNKPTQYWYKNRHADHSTKDSFINKWGWKSGYSLVED